MRLFSSGPSANSEGRIDSALRAFERPSSFAPDLEVEGRCWSTSLVELHGFVSGEISCGILVVGPAGRLEGSANADTVLMQGIVVGVVRARRMYMASTARLEGSAQYEESIGESEAIALLSRHEPVRFL